MSNLSFSEKRTLQRTVDDSLASLAGPLGFKEKRTVQRALDEALQRLGAALRPAESPDLLFLRSVANGAKDSMVTSLGLLKSLLDNIEAAVKALVAAGTDVDAIPEPNGAITRWAELEGTVEG